ncbi:MAG: enoyl-CoA hydratase/isomerase family protein [Anaerolineae bacterium]|nr:enoyl-CoA hydratase/isomerase family protein [Anaerolineae bacterium]
MTDTMQIDQDILYSVDGFVATITLNRPDARNALTYAMMDRLYTIFSELKGNRDVRAVILRGAGGTFCAGGDIKEMRETPLPSSETAGNIDAMLRAINEASQVVIARVDGAAIGAGFGLICVSDIAIASESATFSLPEVRLGLAPAFISPFVIDRVGITRARELFLTGRRFGGRDAEKYGLIHECAADNALDTAVDGMLGHLKQCAPGAIAAAKEIIFEVRSKPTTETIQYRAEYVNKLREAEEAQEGMRAFIEKRPAKWVVD